MLSLIATGMRRHELQEQMLERRKRKRKKRKEEFELDETHGEKNKTCMILNCLFVCLVLFCFVLEMC